MGNSSTHTALSKVVQRAEHRVGRATVESRYHRLPRRLQDDYQLDGEVLGTGANGTVVLATNRHTDARVAVKSLQLNGLKEAKQQDLMGEVEVFLSLDHPHVARLLEVYESEDTLSLVMECMEGGELYERVSQRKVFLETEAADAIWQILLAVNYLHSEGIVHRDLKLENVLYESRDSDYLKVIDFGFSRKLEKSGRLERSCGTMAYVAPEVLNQEAGMKSDLWSVGVIAFILLSGYMPFSGKTDAERGVAIRRGQYTMKSRRWCHISEHARDFVQRLLTVAPERRLDAQQALEHPWITSRRAEADSLRTCIDERIADSLVGFTRQSVFRRGCMRLMAWCLTREERMQVREVFMELDQSHTGAIELPELKRVLQERLHMSEDACGSVVEAFQDLGCAAGGKIHYSDFLAAMMSSRLSLHDELLEETFRRFDVKNCGYLTLSNVHQVLGKTREVDDAFKVVDRNHDGRLSLPELSSYLYSEDAVKIQPPRGCKPKSYRRMATSKAKSLLCSCSAVKTRRASRTFEHTTPQ